jgi:WD40 repeat protein
MLDIGNLENPLTYKTPVKFKLNKTTVICLVSHPAFPVIYAGCSDGKIRIWNYETRKEILSLCLEQKPQPMLCCDFTKQGDFLLSGDEEGAVLIWHTEDPSE